MSQAEVRKLINYDLADADRSQALLRGLPALRRDEQVLTGRDQFSRSFFYFRARKLAKIYKAFEPSVFPEGNFTAFVAVLEKKLGRGKRMIGELTSGAPRSWVEWRHKQTLLRALDETQHLGCYALLYEHARAPVQR